MKTQESRHVSVVETLSALKRKFSIDALESDLTKQRRRISDSSEAREIFVDEMQMFDDRDDEDSISTNSSNVSKLIIS